MKTALRFQIKAKNEFMAMRWSDVLDDIMANSVYPKGGAKPKHSFVAIDVAKELHTRGEF